MRFLLKNKGFTLIELLVTIAIIGLIISVGAYYIINVVKDSKEKSREIAIDSIKKASSLYASEFKQSNDFWFLDQEDNKKEYACTTIKMLINKGYLKEKSIKNIDNIQTSDYIKIVRNIDNKALTGEIITNSEDCQEEFYPEVTFTPVGNKNNGWYNKLDVKIDIVSKDDNLNEVTYYSKIDDVKTNSKTTTETSITMPQVKESSNIKVCVIVVSNMDTLSEEICSDKYKLDTTAPTAPKIAFDSSYNITLKDSNDNLSKNITYHYSLDGTNYQENSSFKPTSSSNLYGYATDYAGNKSEIVNKTIVVENTKTGQVTTSDLVKYHCSVNNKYYDTLTEAQNNCKKVDTVNVITSYYNIYHCSLTNKYYSSLDSANNACTSSYPASISYRCPNGGIQSSSNCSYSLSNTTRTYGLSCTSSCPSGYQPSGSQCIQYANSYVASYTCRAYNSWPSGYCSSVIGNYCYQYYQSRCYSPYVVSGTNYGCPSGYYLSGSTCYRTAPKTSLYTGTGCISNCESNQSCASGYTKSAAVIYDSCPSLIGSSCTGGSTCSTTWAGSCSASGSPVYMCGGSTSSSNTCYSYGTVSTYLEASYSCPSGYTCSGSCNSNSSCSKTINVTPTTSTEKLYYCSLDTTTSYKDEATAKSKCTNICLVGDKYENKCYKLS